jgi:hypothetical protein
MKMDTKELKFKKFIIIYLIIFLIFNAPINVTGIVIAAVHWNTCGTSATNPTISNTLNIWIIVFCSVSLSIGLLTFPLIMISFWRIKNILPIIIVLLTASLFALSWFIYGAVLLFGPVGDGCRYIREANNNYPGFPVWQMAFAVWIIVFLGSCIQNCVQKLARKLK